MKKKSRILIRDVRPILSAINLTCAVTLPVLRSHKRNRDLVFLRMIFTWYCKDQYTLFAITHFLNLKSHAAVIHMIKSFENDIEKTKEFQDLYAKVHSGIPKQKQTTNSN